MKLFSFLALLSLVELRCEGLKITTKSEFIKFTQRVSSGNSFEGVTILLMNDINLDQSSYFIAPYSDSTMFKGTFDGQGYTISNLIAATSQSVVGLFGGTLDADIKNVVLDGTCEIRYNITSQDAEMSIGGITGFFSADEKVSTIENSVSMVKLSFEGSSIQKMFIGGISGYVLGMPEMAVVKNSAFFGVIEVNEHINTAFIGGIVGGINGDVMQTQIVNCLNAGSIGPGENPQPTIITLGGIVGYSFKCNITNCVSDGVISFEEENSTYFMIGKIGGILNYSLVEYCYSNDRDEYPFIYLDDNQIAPTYASIYDSDYILETNASLNEYQGNSLVDALDSYVDYYKLYNLKRWVLNRNYKFRYSIKKNNTFQMQTSTSSLVLLPDLADRKFFHFDGWYTDDAMTTPFTKNKIDEDTHIYGSWGEVKRNFTISFNGTTKPPISGYSGEVVNLPRGLENEEKKLGGWVNEHNEFVSWSFTIPFRDVTLNPIWIDTTINNKKDFMEFINAVGNGADCKDLTIYLTSDIDMEGATIEPIGRIGKPFSGTFDGNGYMLTNLTVKSYSTNVGLFGYSDGMTVRNLILDSSCSVVSIYQPLVATAHEICIGGFIGYCSAIGNNCSAKNLVFFGTVEMLGLDSTQETVHFGGVVGYFHAISYSSNVVNCGFYGALRFSGSAKDIYIGGIVGKCFGTLYSSSKCEIINSLSDISLDVSGTAKQYMDIGGIVGFLDYNSVVRNTVWTGEIEYPKNYTNVCAGSIVGFMKKSLMESCYWNEEYELPPYGTDKDWDGEVVNSSNFDKDFNLDDLESVGSYRGRSVINTMIAFSLQEEHLSRWTLNFYNNSITYVIIKDGKERTIFTVSSNIVLLPEFLDNERNHFSRWYTDPKFEHPFTDNIIYNPITLYGRWEVSKKKYVATIIIDGKKEYTKRISSGRKVLPYLKYPKQKGHKFVHWKDTYGKIVGKDYLMPPQDINFTAVMLKEKISSAKDFISFSKIVNNGVDCAGITIHLEKDIDLDGKGIFDPIGSNVNSFNGVFEGQGYRISNLKIRTSSATQYNGLFGVSFSGAEIRNLVLDSTCSIISSHDYTYTYIGGILGYCLPGDRDCKIENVVNLATIEANGMSGNNELNLGGIIGQCDKKAFLCRINNCANYGSLSSTGIYNKSFIGGIIGVCTGDIEGGCLITNNLNYGTISHTGKTLEITWVDIGGIIGMSSNYNNIVGCVNLGEIYTNQASPCVRSISGNTNILMNYDGSMSTDEASGVKDNFWGEELFYGDYTGSNPEIQKGFNLSNGNSLLLELTSITNNNYPTENIKEDKEYSYKSVWLLNEECYNVTFHLNNKKRDIITYSSKIILVPTVVQSKDYVFYGWSLKKNYKDKIDTRIINKNMVFYGKLVERRYLERMRNISFSILGGIIFIILVFIGGFYYKRYQVANRGNKRVKEMLYPKVYDVQDPDDSLNMLKNLYPSNYVRPEMEDALIEAGISMDIAKDITEVCYNNAYKLSDAGKLSGDITEDDAAAIAMYTFELGYYKYKMNPYRLINNALDKKDIKELQKVKGLLYLVMTALRKLPVVYGINLHRGIRDAVSKDLKSDKFDKKTTNMGFRLTSNVNIKSKLGSADSLDASSMAVWNTLASTSPSMNVTKSFLANGEKKGRAAGTLFIIENGWGYDISPYSLFPNEAEILLEPERQFKVVSVIRSELTIVNLKMLKSPLVLPDVFGVHKTRASFFYFLKFKGDRRDRRNRLARYLQGDNKDENSGTEKGLESDLDANRIVTMDECSDDGSNTDNDDSDDNNNSALL